MVWYPEPWLGSGLGIIIGLYFVYDGLTPFLRRYKPIFHDDQTHWMSYLLRFLMGSMLIVMAIQRYMER